MKKLLTVAGSDCSGGAGIQADLKTFDALGVYGMSCLCALTAQNTTGVFMVANTDPMMVRAQLEAIYDDIPPDGIKTGMLSSPAIAEVTADFLEERRGAPLVVDPVMVATTGAVLSESATTEVYKQKLIPLATVVTPNLGEAEVLSGLTVRTVSDMEEAAKAIARLGAAAVLIKGGHRMEDATDLLYMNGMSRLYRGERIDTDNTHGTGCTLSSALAVYLAQGLPTEEAVEKAKAYVTGAIRAAAKCKIGRGHGPVVHFWRERV